LFHFTWWLFEDFSNVRPSASLVSSLVIIVAVIFSSDTGKTKVVIKILNVLHLHHYLQHYDSLVRTLSARIQQSIQRNAASGSATQVTEYSLRWIDKHWSLVECVGGEVCFVVYECVLTFLTLNL
jgi:hypothetical protein